MDENEKELIRDRTDIVEMISAYTTLKQVGNRFKGLCPFHQEKTPSFTVNPELRRYHCFGCQASGDIFTFLEKIENLTFREAAERLAMRAGITLSRKGVPVEEIHRQQSERDRLFAANAAAVRFFRASYGRATLAQEYAARRGLIQATLDSFGIGYAPDDWSQLANFLLNREKIHSEDAIRAGLITASRRMEGEFTDRFRGRFVFPIVDVQERIIGFGGRLIVDKPDAPKYLNSPETPIFSKSKTLYALNRARKAIQEQNLAVIVEGYMDVVAAHQAGIACVVATLGTAMTAEHVTLLRRYTKNIVLSFDADKAGVKAALKAAELIAGAGEDMTLKVLILPQGEDPDSLIRKGEASSFRKAIESAVTVPEFRLRTLENEHDIRSDSGRAAFLREAIPIIAEVTSLISRDLLIRRITPYHPSFSVSGLRAESSIRAEVERAAARGTASGSLSGTPENSGSAPYTGDSNSGYRRSFDGKDQRFSRPRNENGYRNDAVGPLSLPATQRPNAAEEAERTLIRAFLSEELRPTVCRVLTGLSEPLTYVNPLTAALFALFAPALEGKANPMELLARSGEDELAAYADSVALDETGPSLSVTAVEDAVLRLKKRQIQAKNEQIRSDFARKEGMSTLDEEKLRQYMLRQKALRGGRSTTDSGT